MIVGWISRKHLVSGRGRSFFLTSLLIELIDGAAQETAESMGEDATVEQLIVPVQQCVL